MFTWRSALVLVCTTVVACDGSNASQVANNAPYIIILNGLTGECPINESQYGNGPYAWEYQVLVDGEPQVPLAAYPTARADFEAGTHSIGIKGGYIGCNAVVASATAEFAMGHQYFLLLSGDANGGNAQATVADVTNQMVRGRRDLVLTNLTSDIGLASFVIDGTVTSVSRNGYQIMAHPGAGKPVTINERPDVTLALHNFERQDEFITLIDTCDGCTQEVAHSGYAE